MSRTRVVVTGMGTTSPLGGDVASTWDGMLAGRSGRPHPHRGVGRRSMPVKIAGRVAVEPTEVLERVKARRLDRSSQFAMVAAMEAWRDAGLDGRRSVDQERLGVAMASGIGGVNTLLDNYDILKEKGPRRVSPLAVPMLMPNAPGRQHQPVRRRPGRGQHPGLGVRVRQRGDRAGGRPDPARPGRRRRGRRHRGGDPPAADGGVRQHDGAVEERRRPDHGLPAVGHRPRRLRARRGRRRAGARVRGARPGPRRADLRRGARRRHHRRLPRHRPARPRGPRRRPGHPAGAARSPRSTPPTIVHINAHATSTPQGDIAEGLMLHATLGAHASEVVVTSTKSMTGHLLGGAGALEAIATVLALHHRVVPADDQPRRPGPAGRARHRHRGRATCRPATSPRSTTPSASAAPTSPSPSGALS